MKSLDNKSDIMKIEVLDCQKWNSNFGQHMLIWFDLQYMAILGPPIYACLGLIIDEPWQYEMPNNGKNAHTEHNFIIANIFKDANYSPQKPSIFSQIF